MSAIDLEYRIVPNRIVVPAGRRRCSSRNTLLHPSPEWVLAALGASGFLLVAALAYPRGMGMGDVKLAFFMGAMLGQTVGVALMVGMLAALVPAAVLAVTHGRRRDPEDRDPVCAVPGVRRRRRAVLRERDPRLVHDPDGLMGPAGAQGRGVFCRYLFRGMAE